MTDINEQIERLSKRICRMPPMKVRWAQRSG